MHEDEEEEEEQEKDGDFFIFLFAQEKKISIDKNGNVGVLGFQFLGEKWEGRKIEIGLVF